MTQPAEIDETQSPIASGDRRDEIVMLGPDDFQRIGLQPKETRLEVIRRAASRTARTLARRQLDTPNSTTERQLSRIALSTYRLLDPRQRGDRQSRAHVGRIRPGALYRAGRLEFSNEKILIQSCNSSDISVSTHHVGDISEQRRHATGVRDANGAELNNPPGFSLANARANEGRAYLREIGKTGGFVRLRNRASSPIMVLAIIVALLITAWAIWNWGQELRTFRERFSPTISQHSETL